MQQYSQSKVIRKYLILLYLLCMVLILCTLASCRSSTLENEAATITRTSTEKPTATNTYTQTNTPTYTASPTATINPSKTPSPTITLTSTPISISTPVLEPDSYRLIPWDRNEALNMYYAAQTMILPEEYTDMQLFYRVSLLEEIWLEFPELRNDTELIQDMAEFKGFGDTDYPTYGLIHDHFVESFRLLLEQVLNNGETDLEHLRTWMNQHTPFNLIQESADYLFDQPVSSLVVKIEVENKHNFFIISQSTEDAYTVIALYPEWRPYWWNDENFQITDLNNNGRQEIAILYDGWGSGSTHFCIKSLTLFEWDGTTFRNLISQSDYVEANTDFGSCLEITFPDDPNGGQLIQMGIELNSLCPETQYREITTYKWDGTDFIKQPAQIPTLSQAKQPSYCILDWALTAGPENDAAFQLLSDTLANWPEKADEVWGPAARDYFNIRLAAWKMQRGDINDGLMILQQVRDNPYAVHYPLPSRITKTFLDIYADQGLYTASKEIASLFDEEIELGSVDSTYGCDVDDVRQEWGFVEREWCVPYTDHRPNVFRGTWILELAIKLNPPASLEEALTWLEQNGFHPVWSVQANMDGQGEEDWLIAVEENYQEYNYRFYRFYAFLRQNGQILPLELNFYYYYGDVDGNEAIRFGSLVSPAGEVVENLLQIGYRFYAFRFIHAAGAVEFTIDLDTWDLIYNYYNYHIQVLDWHVEGDQLIVDYDGGNLMYTWDWANQKLIADDYAPEFQEENFSLVEQALYYDDDPERALEMINQLFERGIYEEYVWSIEDDGYVNLPRFRPYLLYLQGLAYERNNEPTQAVEAYWKLWKEYPTFPFSFAAQSKLELR